LREDYLQADEALYRKNFRSKKKIDGYLLNGLYLRELLNAKKERKENWRVITLVRDPIRRNISTFFQVLDSYLLDTGLADRVRQNDPSMIDDLLDYFLHQFDHMYVLKWFDEELKLTFGIDVLQENFDQSKGFQIYQNDAMKVLLIRTENLDRCAEAAIYEFMGIQNFRILPKNIGSQKYYSQAYEEFRKRLRLPDSILDTIYSSEYARKFYSPREIEASKTAWRKSPQNFKGAEAYEA
jgi:putative capsular polysaccharide synthesis protein